MAQKVIKTLRAFNNAILNNDSIYYKGRKGSNKWFGSWKEKTIKEKIAEGLLTVEKSKKASAPVKKVTKTTTKDYKAEYEKCSKALSSMMKDLESIKDKLGI